MGHIDWIPIADLPDELKDGRRILLIDEANPDEAIVGWWSGSEWRDMGDIGCNGMYEYEPTHFAEINAPAAPIALLAASMPGFEG